MTFIVTVPEWVVWAAENSVFLFLLWVPLFFVSAMVFFWRVVNNDARKAARYRRDVRKGAMRSSTSHLGAGVTRDESLRSR